MRQLRIIGFKVKDRLQGNQISRNMREVHEVLADPFSDELVRLCNSAIASKKHALDFWTIPTDPSTSFGQTGDPLASIRNGDAAGFDCLADFMGTSQNNLSGTRGNPDGITWFWFSSDGSELSSDSVSWPGWFDSNYSGMYGLVEWARYCQTITGVVRQKTHKIHLLRYFGAWALKPESWLKITR